MGGAVGKLMGGSGGVISTAASLLGSDRSEQKYYRSLAKVAEEQARQTEENARRNAEYKLQEAGVQTRQLQEQYNSLVGTQKASFAAGGINGQSATAQLILKNSRLNAQLDQDMLARNLDQSISQANTAAALEAQELRNQAKQYRQAAKNRWNVWSKLSSTIGGFFGSQTGA